MNRRRPSCWRLNSFISDSCVNRYVLLSHWSLDNVSQGSKLGRINFDGENLINGQYTRIHSSPLQAENVAKDILKRYFFHVFLGNCFCIILFACCCFFFLHFTIFFLHGFSCPSETLDRRVWSAPYPNEKLPISKAPLNF